MNEDTYKLIDQLLDELMFMIGDSRIKPTEDELLNVIIATREILRFRKIRDERCE